MAPVTSTHPFKMASGPFYVAGAILMVPGAILMVFVASRKPAAFSDILALPAVLRWLPESPCWIVLIAGTLFPLWYPLYLAPLI